MALCIARLLEDLKTPLYRFISKRVANQQDAEDILQDVFLKIVDNMDKLVDLHNAKAWVYRITRNTIVDYYRKKQRTIEHLEFTEEMTVTFDEELPLNHQLASCLKTMISDLPQKYQQAILLTAFENRTQKEYSEMIGISLSAAKSRVQRARSMLKDMVLECCRLEFDLLGNVIDYQKRSDQCKYC